MSKISQESHEDYNRTMQMMIESSASADLFKSEQHLPKISDAQIYHSAEKEKP